MSSQTTNMQPPFQQWQNFGQPYMFDPSDTYKVIENINDSERNLTAGLSSVSKDINQSSLGLRDAIEKGNAMNGNAIERTAGQAQTTMERVGATNQSATERACGQVNAAVERNGGNITTAIEKVAGEQRLTTTVTDAASRQAAADSARDIAIAVERNGANSVNAVQNANTSLLGSIERNAGENRVTTVTTSGQLDAKLTDVRHSILNDVNRSASEMINSNVQSLNVLTKHVTDGAWETRQALSSGFSTIAVGQEKVKADLTSQAADHYASMMLEQQKLGQFLASKSDNQFAMTQMEVMKCKSDLSAQSAQQFAANQLENQKLGSMISAQLAEAKYDALKNTQDLGNKIEKCCCELKEKTDLLDRERLRDEVIRANSDNNLLKTPYTLGAGILGGYGYPGFGPGFGPGVGYGHHGGFGPGVGYGNNVHIHSQDREDSPGPFRGGGGGHGGPP